MNTNNLKEFLNSGTPLTWVFYGDSITHTKNFRDYTELLLSGYINKEGQRILL